MSSFGPKKHKGIKHGQEKRPSLQSKMKNKLIVKFNSKIKYKQRLSKTKARHFNESVKKVLRSRTFFNFAKECKKNYRN